jgi:hypothetical protein
MLNPNETLEELWCRHRDKRYTTSAIDKLRCSTIQMTYEQGRNFIDEEMPRSGKSEGNNIWPVVWQLEREPNFKVGLITHRQNLGNKFLAPVMAALRADGFEFDYERAAEFKIKGSAGVDPSMWVSGIDGGHTGKGCHRLILDDLLRSGSDAMSPVIREQIIRDVVSTGLNRLEPFNGRPGAVTILQARLHKGDPIGWFLNESELPYVRLHLPAINDDGRQAFLENTYE